MRRVTGPAGCRAEDADGLQPSHGGRNDSRNSRWQGSPAIAGDNTNLNAEKFNTNFDAYQELTGLPNGIYEVSVQAFYRYGGHGATPAANARAAGTETIRAFLYAGNEQTALPSIFEAAGRNGSIGVSSPYGYVPDSQSDGSSYMSAGLYWSNPVRVTVENGSLRLGIRKTTTVTNDWTLFDNFRLTYLGTGRLTGDVNHDNMVNTADVVAIVRYLAGLHNESFDESLADVSGDDNISLADVTALVNLILEQ